MYGRDRSELTLVSRADRRVGARLFGRWRGLSAVPVWPIGWSLVLYIYTSSPLGLMSASAALRIVSRSRWVPAMAGSPDAVWVTASGEASAG